MASSLGAVFQVAAEEGIVSLGARVLPLAGLVRPQNAEPRDVGAASSEEVKQEFLVKAPPRRYAEPCPRQPGPISVDQIGFWCPYFLKSAGVRVLWTISRRCSGLS